MLESIIGLFDKGSLGNKLATAVVVDNNDPLQIGRIKFRISTLHSGRSDTELTWAAQLHQSSQGNTTYGIGEVGVPVVGAKVIIFFPEDDEHNAYYLADYHDTGSKITELLEDYPNSYGRIDASGNLFLVNTTANTVRFVHVSGTTITIGADGTITFASAASINLLAQNTINIRSSTHVYIDAPTSEVRIQEGLAAAVPANTPRTRPSPSTGYTDATLKDY